MSFVIACFTGLNKPLNLKEFLDDFVNEASKLQQDGIFYNDEKKKIQNKKFQLRDFITGVHFHNGKHSCPKCSQIGTYYKSRVCFSPEIASLRSDNSFENRTDVLYHSASYLHMKSPLEFLKVGMVSQFPLDPMHLIDLGVVKKILNRRKCRIDEYPITGNSQVCSK